MDSETRDILDGNAELGPDGYDTAAGAELGQLVAQSVARTGPLNPDAVTFDSLLDVDYNDCAIGACTPSLHVQPKGKRPEMTFWEAHRLIDNARQHGVPLKVTARTCTLLDRALQAAAKHSERTEHAMRVSYTYETLPGPIGGTEVVIVDEPTNTNVRPGADGVGWRFVAPPTASLDVQAALDDAVALGYVEVVDEAPATEPAHEPYIGYVAKMLNNAGVPTPDVEVEDDDVAKAYIQMYDADPDTGREVFLCWNEESGWYRGIDQNGSGELNCIRWAHLGVLPEPREVVAWVAAQETAAATFEQMRRPHYRDTGDTFEAAKFLGELGDYCRRYEYQQWCEKVAASSCVDCGGSLKNGFGYAPEHGEHAGRCPACG